jgi:hypothetical protein
MTLRVFTPNPSFLNCFYVLRRPRFRGFRPRVPFFLLQIACEVVLGLCTQQLVQVRPRYVHTAGADSLGSIGAGSLDQLFFKLMLQPIAITSAPYNFIHQTHGVSLPTLLPPQQQRALHLLVLVLLVDFGTPSCPAFSTTFPQPIALLVQATTASTVRATSAPCYWRRITRAPHQRVFKPHHGAALKRIPELLLLADQPASPLLFPLAMCAMPPPPRMIKM